MDKSYAYSKYLVKHKKKETVEFALNGLEDKMKVTIYKSLPSQKVLEKQIRKIEERLLKNNKYL